MPCCLRAPIYAIAKIGTKEGPYGEGPKKERAQGRIHGLEGYRAGKLGKE